MKKWIKVVALCLAAAVLAGALAACNNGASSGGAGGQSSQAAVQGSEETWGNITVLVPADMTLKGGSLVDEDDPNTVWLQVTGNEMHYLQINVVDPESVQLSLDTTREFNEGAKDVTITAGAEWSGVAYVYSGSVDCFQMAGTVDGKTVLVGGAWFAYDADVTQAVLSSLKIK